MGKHKSKHYAVYNQENELIDVLELKKVQYTEYKKNNPNYIIEEIYEDDIEIGLDLDCFIDGYYY